MATLVLTAVGSVVGGPIGAALGAVLGQQIDQAVFKPAARQGPRLSDLAVQTSTYGSRLPKLFGSVRVSGTVVWATDLIETRTRQGGGKGRAATDTYSYSASFAVALSARRVERIGRIWADGKLLRGVAGDLKTPGALRLHVGDDDQPVDPMIAAAEGIDATPAYRATAYAVFEALQLADYGNRIPSLSFEVIADSAAIGLGDALGELSDATVTAAPGPLLGGLAATGDSVRGVAEAFAPLFAVLCRDDGGRPALAFAPSPAPAPPRRDLGASATEAAGTRMTTEIDPLETVPAAVSIVYFDAARGYQPGLQRARREGPGRREVRGDLPATLDAASARRIAEAVVARGSVERRRATVTLPWRMLMLRPGDSFSIDGTAWRVREWRLDAMVVTLELVATMPVVLPTASGGMLVEPGRSIAEYDAPHGPTMLAIVDLPPLGDSAVSTPQVAVFANGTSPGWRRALLMNSIDGGATFAAAGTTAAPAVLGKVVGTLAAGPVAIIDRRATIEVELINDALALFDADLPSLLAGTNLAMVGGEAFQFGRAVPLGNRRWRLSQLLRGRRGTEDAVGGHRPDESFVIVDPLTAALTAPDRVRAGVVVLASGIGDDDPLPTATLASAGRAIRPLSPVALAAIRLANGDTEVRWIRRSREGWAWRDFLDAPVAEEREAYRVTRNVSGVECIDEVGEAVWRCTAAQRAADAALGLTTLTVRIAQLGTGGLSATATIVLPTT